MIDAGKPVECRVSGISLRLRAPEGELGAVLRKWGFEVGRSWIAGEPRTTPRGDPLNGRYRESYAYAKLDLPEQLRLSACLGHVADGLEPIAPQIAEFVDMGGYAELFVGWGFNSNSGDELGWCLLGRLAAMRLALSLDVYPMSPELEDS